MGSGEQCYLYRDLGRGAYGGDVFCLQEALKKEVSERDAVRSAERGRPIECVCRARARALLRRAARRASPRPATDAANTHVLLRVTSMGRRARFMERRRRSPSPRGSSQWA